MTSTACVVVIEAFNCGDNFANAIVSSDRAVSSVTALRAAERNESGNWGECSAKHCMVMKGVPFRKSLGVCGLASIAVIALAKRPMLYMRYWITWKRECQMYLTVCCGGRLEWPPSEVTSTRASMYPFSDSIGEEM